MNKKKSAAEMTLAKAVKEIAQWIGASESSLSWMDEKRARAYLMYLQNRMVVIENQKDLDLSMSVLNSVKKYGVFVNDGKYYILSQAPTRISEDSKDEFMVNALATDEFNAKTIYFSSNSEKPDLNDQEDYEVLRIV
jgi:hypothetical protein